MEIYFAPLEGITYYNFRRIHHRIYPGIDKYYTPFVVATSTRKMKSREKRDILPENNKGVPVVPQILTNRAEEFLFSMRYMAEFGYTEVNLNAGCPVGTVTAKGKGAGLLKDPDRLDAFLYDLFDGLEKKPVYVKKTADRDAEDRLRTNAGMGRMPGPVKPASGTARMFDPVNPASGTTRMSGSVKPASGTVSVSVKTRLGWEDPAEFKKILEVYLRYPISELIIHARTRKELYTGEPEMEAFSDAYEAVKGGKFPMKLCYNGNIRTPEEIRELAGRYPELDSVMIGRGLLSNPELVTRFRSGTETSETSRKAADETKADRPDEHHAGSPGGHSTRTDIGKLKEFHEELYRTYAEQFGDNRVLIDHMKELWGYFGENFPEAGTSLKSIRKSKTLPEYEAAVRMLFSQAEDK